MVLTAMHAARRTLSPTKAVDGAINDALNYLADSFEVDSTRRHVQCDTKAVETPASTQSTPTAELSPKRKRVAFATLTNCYTASELDGLTSGKKQYRDAGTQDRHAKALKSILKRRLMPHTQQTGEQSSTPSTSIDDVDQSFSDSLQAAMHTLKQSGEEKSEAYAILLQLWMTGKSSSRQACLRICGEQVVNLILRDTKSAIRDAARVDIRLLTQATKLLSHLLTSPSMSVIFGRTLCFRIFDHSLGVLEASNMPRLIVKNHLKSIRYIVDLAPVLDSSRGVRLLKTLRALDPTFYDQTVSHAKLSTYALMLTKAPTMMSNSVNLWIHGLFEGMFSRCSNTCTRSIEVATRAAQNTEHDTRVSQAVFDLLSQKRQQGLRYAEDIAARLLEMLGGSDSISVVPRIWTVVILFLSGKRQNLTQWQDIDLWISISSKCLAIKDGRTAALAHQAWAKFIYVIRPDVKTSPELRTKLLQPIRDWLHSARTESCVLHSYHALIYYTLPPTSSDAQKDFYWKSYVFDVLNEFIPSSKHLADRLCEMLHSFFGREDLRSWKECRVFSESRLVAEELPSLEPKWIRRNVESILKLMVLCFRHCSSETQDGRETPAEQTWKALLHAITRAGDREIRLSRETKNSTARIIDALKDIVNTNENWTSSGTSDRPHLRRSASLISTTIEVLKPANLLQSVSARSSPNTADHGIESPQKADGMCTTRSPILEVASWLLSDFGTSVTSHRKLLVDVYCRLIDTSIHAAKDPITSLELLGEFQDIASRNWLHTIDQDLLHQIWDYTSDIAVQMMPAECDCRAADTLANHKTLSEACITLLRKGFEVKPASAVPLALNFLRHMFSQGKGPFGEDDMIIMVVEPLGNMLETAIVENEAVMLPLISELLRCGCLAYYQEILDAGDFRANFKDATGRSKLTTSYERILDTATHMSKLAFADRYEVDIGVIDDFLSSLSILFAGVDVSKACKFISRLRDGILPWFSDEFTRPAASNIANRLRDLVSELWNKTVRIVEDGVVEGVAHQDLLDDIAKAGSSSGYEELRHAAMDVCDRSCLRQQLGIGLAIGAVASSDNSQIEQPSSPPTFEDDEVTSKNPGAISHAEDTFFAEENSSESDAEPVVQEATPVKRGAHLYRPVSAVAALQNDSPLEIDELGGHRHRYMSPPRLDEYDDIEIMGSSPLPIETLTDGGITDSPTASSYSLSVKDGGQDVCMYDIDEISSTLRHDALLHRHAFGQMPSPNMSPSMVPDLDDANELSSPPSLAHEDSFQTRDIMAGNTSFLQVNRRLSFDGQKASEGAAGRSEIGSGPTEPMNADSSIASEAVAEGSTNQGLILEPTSVVKQGSGDNCGIVMARSTAEMTRRPNKYSQDVGRRSPVFPAVLSCATGHRSNTATAGIEDASATSGISTPLISSGLEQHECLSADDEISSVGTSYSETMSEIDEDITQLSTDTASLPGEGSEVGMRNMQIRSPTSRKRNGEGLYDCFNKRAKINSSALDSAERAGGETLASSKYTVSSQTLQLQVTPENDPYETQSPQYQVERAAYMERTETTLSPSQGTAREDALPGYHGFGYVVPGLDNESPERSQSLRKDRGASPPPSTSRRSTCTTMSTLCALKGKRVLSHVEISISRSRTTVLEASQTTRDEASTEDQTSPLVDEGSLRPTNATPSFPEAVDHHRNRSVWAAVGSTPQDISLRLRNILLDCQALSLQPDQEPEIAGLLDSIKEETSKACRRGTFWDREQEAHLLV